MVTLSIRQVGSIVLASVALAVLYFGTQTVDLERHERTARALRDLKNWDAILKQDVLRTRTGLLNHYDTLVSTMQAMREAHERLVDVPAVIQGDANIDFETSLETLGKNLDARALDLERYKSRNAILKNSLSYLPIATRRLTQRLSGIPGTSKLAVGMSQVLRDTLVYNLNGDGELHDDLQSTVAAVGDAARTLANEPREEVENVLSHVAIVLATKPMLDELVVNLMASESVARIDAVVGHYDAGFARVQKRADFYRLLLYGLSVLLLLYVAYILVQLKRAAESLQKANAELEERVAARTAELVEMNSSLRVHLDRFSVVMEQAEGGDLEAHLPTEGEGIYAILYRRFNRMIDGIRDEAQILKVAQELSGELQLDVVACEHHGHHDRATGRRSQHHFRSR